MITLSSNLKVCWPYVLLLPLTVLSLLRSRIRNGSPQTSNTNCPQILEHCTLTLYLATSNWSSVTSCSKKFLGLFIAGYGPYFWVPTSPGLYQGFTLTYWLPLSTENFLRAGNLVMYVSQDHQNCLALDRCSRNA